MLPKTDCWHSIWTAASLEMQIDVRKFFGIFETFNAKTDIFIARRCCCCCCCCRAVVAAAATAIHTILWFQLSKFIKAHQVHRSEPAPNSLGARVKREL